MGGGEEKNAIHWLPSPAAAANPPKSMPPEAATASGRRAGPSFHTWTILCACIVLASLFPEALTRWFLACLGKASRANGARRRRLVTAVVVPIASLHDDRRSKAGGRDEENTPSSSGPTVVMAEWNLTGSQKKRPFASWGDVTEAELLFMSLASLPSRRVGPFRTAALSASLIGVGTTVEETKRLGNKDWRNLPFFRALEDPGLLFVAGPVCLFNGTVFVDYDLEGLPRQERAFPSSAVAPVTPESGDADGGGGAVVSSNTMPLTATPVTGVAINSGRFAHAFFPLSDLPPQLVAAARAELNKGTLPRSPGGPPLLFWHEDDTHHLYHTVVDAVIPMRAFMLKNGASPLDADNDGNPLFVAMDANRVRPWANVLPAGVPQNTTLPDRFGTFLPLLSGLVGTRGGALWSSTLHLSSQRRATPWAGPNASTLLQAVGPNDGERLQGDARLRCFRGAVVGMPSRTHPMDTSYFAASTELVSATLRLVVNVSYAELDHPSSSLLSRTSWNHHRRNRSRGTNTSRSGAYDSETSTTTMALLTGESPPSPRRVRVTIIERRSTRRFAQATVLRDELSRQADWFDVALVQLEALTLAEQLLQLGTTDILIGVHGMGLTWLCFLPKHGAVIELNGWHHPLADFQHLALGCRKLWYRVMPTSVQFIRPDGAIVHKRGLKQQLMAKQFPHTKKEFWLQIPSFNLSAVMDIVMTARGAVLHHN